MKKNVMRAILAGGLILLVAACSAKTPTGIATSVPATPDYRAEANQALQTFFDDLNRGDYDAAVALYGGSYDWLSSMNPDIDSGDHVSLFKQGCRFNGFKCLKTMKVTFDSQPSPNEFVFLVQFQNADGTLFVQGPCCGEDETTSPPVSEFKYTVTRTEAGLYLVMSEPPYVP
jgi:hypothetical protein